MRYIVTVTLSVGCHCEYPSPRHTIHPVSVSDSLPNITLAFKTFEFRFQFILRIL